MADSVGLTAADERPVEPRIPYLLTLRAERITESAFFVFLSAKLAERTILDAALCPEIGVAALRMATADAESLRRDPAVLQVVLDLPISSPLPGPLEPSEPAPRAPGGIPFNIQMVRAPECWSQTEGQGVKVAIIDSGIAKNVAQLPVSGGVSFVSGKNWWDDEYEHGTRVAGIVGARHQNDVVGVAPECELYAVKVLDEFGRTTPSKIIRGMCWAGNEGMQVVNLSVGAMGPDPETCGVNYCRASRFLVERGCFVVAAAGNSGSSEDHWVYEPARCSAVVAVGAVKKTEQREPESPWGPGSEAEGVELMAPGWKLWSTSPGDRYGPLAYTSAACPHVAGAAALLIAASPESATLSELRLRLRRGAKRLGSGNYDIETGFGLTDCEKSLRETPLRRAASRIRRLFSTGPPPPPGP